MKKLLLSVTLSLLFLFSFNPGDEAFAYDKKSLVERFTNCSCGPCATINNAWYNATTANLINSGAISHIIYNTWWPSSSDPMYLLNQADNTTRTNYYQPSSPKYVPWIEVNGNTTATNLTAFNNAVNNGNNEYAPFDIVLTQEAFSETLIRIGVKIIRDPNDNTTFGNIKLRVALTEKTVSFASPPGSNTESEFFSVCRKMMPNAGGTTFTIPAPGDSIELSVEYVPTTAFLQAVNLDSIRVVAFIQEDPNQTVYQSEMMEVTPYFKATFSTEESSTLTDPSEPANFDVYLSNIGILPDTYTLAVDLEGPGGWTVTFTTAHGTFNLGETDTVTVVPGDSTQISVEANANSIQGYGIIILSYVAESGNVGQIELHRTTYGVDILVVDDNGGTNYEEWIIVELDLLNKEYGIATSDAVINAGEDINTFNTIIWSCANYEPTIEPDEMEALKTFLDNGGYLYLSGVDIAYELADPTSPYYTTETADFATNYLHINYILKEFISYNAEGIDGDPISNGFSIIGFYGGTGAGTLNHSQGHYPNQIDAADTASAPFLHFFLKPDEFCGVRAMHYGPMGVGRVVFTTFGFETIADATVRSLFAEKVTDWLTVPVGVNEFENNAIPTSYGLEQNYPNPFNPSTTITYSLANDEHVSLKVYDIIGREIAELVNEDQAAGTYSLDLDASSLASGMYFYKITAGNFVSTKKMVLLK